MNVTPKVVEKVAAYVTDKGRPLETIRAELNKPAFDNPLPQGQIKPALSFAGIAAVVAPASLGKVMTYAHLDKIIDDIRKQDIDAAALWVQGLAAAGLLTADDVVAVSGVISSTTPDPNWKAKLSWAEVNLGDTLTEQDMIDCATYGKWSQ